MQKFDRKDRDAIKEFVMNAVKEGGEATFRICNIKPKLEESDVGRISDIRLEVELYIIAEVGFKKRRQYYTPPEVTPSLNGRSCRVKIRRK